jgi:hypothetical protein
MALANTPIIASVLGELFNRSIRSSKAKAINIQKSISSIFSHFKPRAMKLLQ